jgi:hypothetical protein
MGTITIRDRSGKPVMVIDRNEWERAELEAREHALAQELEHCRRELQQLRDTHAMEVTRG